MHGWPGMVTSKPGAPVHLQNTSQVQVAPPVLRRNHLTSPTFGALWQERRR